jgi:hypothetical protein
MTYTRLATDEIRFRYEYPAGGWRTDIVCRIVAYSTATGIARSINTYVYTNAMVSSSYYPIPELCMIQNEAQKNTVCPLPVVPVLPLGDLSIPGAPPCNALAVNPPYHALCKYDVYVHGNVYVAAQQQVRAHDDLAGLSF